MKDHVNLKISLMAADNLFSLPSHEYVILLYDVILLYIYIYIYQSVWLIN